MPRQVHLPISFACFNASIRALARLWYQGGHSFTEAMHKLILTFPAEGYRSTETQNLPRLFAKAFLQTRFVGLLQLWLSLEGKYKNGDHSTNYPKQTRAGPPFGESTWSNNHKQTVCSHRQYNSTQQYEITKVSKSVWRLHKSSWFWFIAWKALFICLVENWYLSRQYLTDLIKIDNWFLSIVI